VDRDAITGSSLPHGGAATSLRLMRMKEPALSMPLSFSFLYSCRQFTSHSCTTRRRWSLAFYCLTLVTHPGDRKLDREMLERGLSRVAGTVGMHGVSVPSIVSLALRYFEDGRLDLDALSQNMDERCLGESNVPEPVVSSAFSGSKGCLVDLGDDGTTVCHVKPIFS
jgi:hypothetical protein